MIDYRLKYMDITRAWPNKAGKWAETLQGLNRKVLAYSKKAKTPEEKELLIACADAHDIMSEALEYCHNIVKGCAADSEYLMEGANYRTVIQNQSELLEELLNLKNEIKR